jgi:hypothetical protein
MVCAASRARRRRLPPDDWAYQHLQDRAKIRATVSDCLQKDLKARPYLAQFRDRHFRLIRRHDIIALADSG